MFKQMSKTGATLALIPRANIVRNRNCHHGRCVIFHSDHAQPVFQRGLFEIHMYVPSRLRLGIE
jgi:hypothetical protein